MRTTIAVVMFALASICQAQTNHTSLEIPDGSNAVLTVKNFLRIKDFILTTGHRRTYCQMYNNNPFFAFKDMNIYLNPDTGQANINCQTNLSDFNTMNIQIDGERHIEYYRITLDPDKRSHLHLSQHDRDTSPAVLESETEQLICRALREVEQKITATQQSGGAYVLPEARKTSAHP